MGETLNKGAEGENDIESRLCAVKLSGKRTAVSKTSGETSYEVTEGVIREDIADNLSGKGTGANLK